MAKLEIWQGLRSHNLCTDARVEWPIDSRQADVFAHIDGHSVAIEVQNSDENFLDVGGKISDYSCNGVYTLYVIPHTIPRGGSTCSLIWWKQYLHALYHQRLYFWFGGARVIPVHLGSYKDIPIRAGRPWTMRDYYQPRPVNRYEGRQVHIAEFQPIVRSDTEMVSRHVGMPKQSLLWIDQLGSWWEQEVEQDAEATRWRE